MEERRHCESGCVKGKEVRNFVVYLHVVVSRVALGHS
jgi:hypothetical protein